MWHQKASLIEQSTSGVKAACTIPEDSDWFCGHFPGNPVLPAIAQIGLAADALLHYVEGPVRVTGFRRVRFKQLIRPDDPITVHVEPDPKRPGLYSFRLMVGDDPACTGLMTVQTGDNTENPGSGHATRP